MKRKAHAITDRAKRYRANRNPPPGRKLCNFCGNKKNVDIDHVTGDESDDTPANKIFLCRACNTRKGIVQKRNRIGVRTRQFNPHVLRVPTFAEFKHSAAVLLGLAEGDAGEATEVVRITPPEKRAAFAEKIEANPAPTFEQYVHAVMSHQRRAHDQAGKVIHATPKRLRSEYAMRIAETKRQRRGVVPF